MYAISGYVGKKISFPLLKSCLSTVLFVFDAPTYLKFHSKPARWASITLALPLQLKEYNIYMKKKSVLLLDLNNLLYLLKEMKNVRILKCGLASAQSSQM